MSAALQSVRGGIMDGDSAGVRLGVREAIASGIPVQEVIDSMSLAMAEVGNLFEAGEYFVPEMLVAARAMQAGMDELKPRLLDSDARTIGLVVAGTVQGDLHEIGKNLVCMLLECAGFRVIDLGMDVAPETFVRCVQEEHPQVVAMSALLTTTMTNMKTTIEALHDAGLRDLVKIMVGGAPLTEAFAQQIGADAYAQNASQAVKCARKLVGAP